MSQSYPIVFMYRDLIPGNGFIAAVAMRGYALLAEEGDKTWMYGVQPGGIAGGGVNCRGAFNEFKRSYMSVLLDIAGKAASFEEFRSEIEGFFGAINVPVKRYWELVLRRVRRGKMRLEEFEQVSADKSPPELHIYLVELQHVKPDLATLGCELVAA